MKKSKSNLTQFIMNKSKCTLSLIALFCLFMFANGCKDTKVEIEDVKIDAITATGTSVTSGSDVTIDLNGSATAVGVPIKPTITITFSKDIDEASVTTSSITLGTSSKAVQTSVSVTGAVVTLVLADGVELARGTDYTLSLLATLKGADTGEFLATSRTFSTGGVAEVTPPKADSQVAYWSFDGNSKDEIGTYIYMEGKETAITYEKDRHDQVGRSASFDGDESIIEIPDADTLLITKDFTLSFWVKSNSSDKDDKGITRGQFVLGLAGKHGFQFEISSNYGNCKLAATYSLDNDEKKAEDLKWLTTGKTKDNGGYQGFTFDKDVSSTGGLAGVLADKWAHVVCSYDAETKIGTMYMNGELVKSQDFNLYDHQIIKAVGMGYDGKPAPGNKLAFGFIQGSENMALTEDWAKPIGTPDNNHFKGELDDVRIFHASFTSDEVKELYNAEKAK